MKNKRIIISLIILIVVIIIFCIFEYYLYLKNNIRKFEPFTKNNVLKKYETSLKLKDNLPKIEAASAFYPFAAGLVQNVYSEKLYSKELLQLVSTSQAYEDIVNERADIIIATEPSEEQKKMIKNLNINLEYKVVFLEPLDILLNNSNSIENLSIEQIQDIYFGNYSNWNTYQLEKNNGSQTCFESIVKNNELSKNHYEIKTMPKIIDKISADKKGIGYAFNSYFSKMHPNSNSKVISVNNKSIGDTEYPLLFEVYLIYRTDNRNENIPKIVNWLDTKEGKSFIDSIK